MKKYFYLACCFLAATTFALTSCDEEETIIDEPDVPETPTDEPDDEEETLTYSGYQIDLNRESTITGGDSIAFFEAVDAMLLQVQDSLENAGSGIVLSTDEQHTILFYGENSQEVRGLSTSLTRKLNSLGTEEQDFVYSGVFRILSLSVSVSAGNLSFSGGNVSGSMSVNVYVPNLAETTWATDTENAPVQSVSFIDNNPSFINGDETTTFKKTQVGYDVTLTASGDESQSYAFQFNEDGSELTLVSINGEAAGETYVYTRQ